MLKGHIIILILLVLLFIWVFVIPIARSKAGGEKEAFDDVNYMSDYTNERAKMINMTNQIYNPLGASLDPLIPHFAVAKQDIDPTLSDNQYILKFNQFTNASNQQVLAALQTPDQSPTGDSATFMGIVPQDVTPQLPGPNDMYIAAVKCQANLKTRASCSQLNDPANQLCGICIKGGTALDGSSPKTYIGGLLSLFQDRRQQEEDAGDNDPIYQPSLGMCPPGMFYVDADSCTKAVNQLNCKEIGETGGFNGGSTTEGLTLDSVSCAQAPVAGSDVFVYQPSNQAYTVLLRIITPFNTGITKVVATHRPSGRSYTATNEGKAGQEFTLKIPNVIEADTVDVLVAQEAPNRTNGQSEVFLVKEASVTGNRTYDADGAKTLCNRLGTSVATSAQINEALENGLQSQYCGMTSDVGGMFAAQSGSSKVQLLPVGSAPSTGLCGPAVGAWCYGFKPAETLTSFTTTNPIKTKFISFFDSFGDNATPPQGLSQYSRFSTEGELDPPGHSNRAVIIQWEMAGSNSRTIPFQQTITMINGFPTNNVLRLLGPYTRSSLISGPSWNSDSTIVKNQFWFWSNQPKSQTVVFTSQVPGFLNNPYYTDDIARAPNGPLISKQSTSALLQTSACMAKDQTPGNYGAACLLELFQGVGGIPGKGKLSTENGGLSQLNSMGDIDAISAYLNGLYSAATSGRDGDGNLISNDSTTRMNAMNDAAQKLFGFDILNPCETIVDNADGSVGVVPTPIRSVTSDCLQFLWLNAGSNESRIGNNGATYTSILDRFSGLLKTESLPAKRKQYPFQACQLTGSMSPIKNGQPDMAVVSNLLKKNKSILDIQNYFDSIHKTANNFANDYKGDKQSAGAQALAINQCYGINQIKSPTVGYGCGSWTPQNLVGLKLWLDGADPDGSGNKQDVGTVISTWKDKSSLNNDATATGNPSLASLNNRTAVFFDGGSYLLGKLRNNSRLCTVFAVVMMSGRADNNSRIVSLSSNGDVDYTDSSEVVPLYQAKSTTALGTGRATLPPGGSGNWTFATIVNNNLNANVPYIAGSLYDMNGGNLFINGSLFKSSNAAGIFNISEYGIGNYSGTPIASEPFKGLIAEVLVFSSALSDNERQQIEGYLAWKWGLQNSLPANHNFKSTPIGGDNIANM